MPRAKTKEKPSDTPVLDRVTEWQKKLAERNAQRKLNRGKKLNGGAAAKLFNTKEKRIAVVTAMAERVASGEAISAICDEVGFPARNIFYNWVNNDPELMAIFKPALSLRGELYAEMVSELSLEALHAPPELTQAYRLAVESSKWIACKLLPKTYGDKVIHSGDAENPLAIQHVLAGDDLASKIRGEK